MNLKLIRYGSIPNRGTFGEITVEGKKFYTVEREWLNNEPMVSCIPKGHYTMEPHHSRRFGETWALVGDGVTHYDEGEDRFGILFHVANKQKDIQGCIGLGLALGNSWNVINSRDATNFFLALLAHESRHELEIV